MRASRAGNRTPLKGFSNSIVPFGINFVVGTRLSNEHVVRIGEILQKFISATNGASLPVDNGNVIMTFGVPTFFDLETRGGVGDSVICSFEFTVNYSENAVTSASRRWFLDGMELPYLSEIINNTRSGVTNNISGKKATKSQTLQQVKTFIFTLPFDSSNSACVGLQKDILDGDPQKTYELKFYDGVSYTESEPFVKTVTLFETSEADTEAAQVTGFTVSFVEADTVSQTGIRYYMALIDNQFSENTENTRRFDTLEEQQTWYEDKIANGGADWVQILAPNLQGLTVTQQVYRNENNYELMWLVQKNFAVIKIVNHDDASVADKYYYFIAGGGR